MSELQPIPDFDDIAGFLASSGMAQRTIGDLALDVPIIVANLRSADPIRTAATIGGLLAHPALQANCGRLEVLAHLAVRHAAGRRQPTRDLVSRSFFALGSGWVGRMEDPAEDVFISLVTTRQGNFRIFPGIATGAPFYLRIFLEIIDQMPPGMPFDRMRGAVYGLLRLSEAVAERNGLKRHMLGGELPHSRIPPHILDALSDCRSTVTFTNDDLLAIGVSRADLSPFAFLPSGLARLDLELLGHTSLERHPLIFTEDGIVLALPSAVSTSIRRYVIETCRDTGRVPQLEKALEGRYGKLLHELPILGGPTGAPSNFQQFDKAIISTFRFEVDSGRWLHIVAVLDAFDGYDDQGLCGLNPDPDGLGSAVTAAISQAHAETSGLPGFRSGISLVVSCGWGRGVRLALPQSIEDWRVEIAAAHDLETLSNLPKFRPTILWRMLDMADELERQGLVLQNANGLLNLIAWARSLDHHLVPHAQIPDNFTTPGDTSILMIDQNAIREVYREVALAVDRHRLPDTLGRWVSVCRIGNDAFPEDAHVPAYVAEDDIRLGRLNGAYETPSRTWWAEVTSDGSRKMTYKYWSMLLHWLGETALVLDAEFVELPIGPICWIADFEDLAESGPIPETPFDVNHVDNLITLAPTSSRNTISLKISKEFQSAFNMADNAAERILVKVFLLETVRLAENELTGEQVDILVDKIVRNTSARHIHMFAARTFRSAIAQALPSEIVRLTKMDSAHLKLGLGWRARSRDEGSTIEGKTACTTFLNTTVQILEDDLCAAIRLYDRKALLTRVILNFEAVSAERDLWRRTSSALVALRRDREAVLQTLATDEAGRNAVIAGSRILVEAAMCEAVPGGREDIGEIDLSRMMALACALIANGGWSDAIRWDAMEPKLKISSLGDILTASTFEEDVIAPFGRPGNDVLVNHAIDGYREHYEITTEVQDFEAHFDPQFIAAWRVEFGFSLDQGRLLIEAIENVGIQRQQAVFEIRESKLIDICEKSGVTPDATSAFIGSFTMVPRISWKSVPPGYRLRDRDPWRIRRRLSLLRQPILQISNDTETDIEILIAPGILRESFGHQLRSFNEGDFGRKQASSKEMQAWIGEVNNRSGHAFNVDVMNRMRELGWEAESDVRITRLLRKGFAPKDYGDVDVLAWNQSTGRVLLIECKDLQYQKTHGEIAEQMSGFRGELDDDGKPDRLRKHLDRFDIVSAHMSAVEQFTQIQGNLKIECHLVFRNPVPMKYMWDRLAHRVRLSLFGEIQAI